MLGLNQISTACCLRIFITSMGTLTHLQEPASNMLYVSVCGDRHWFAWLRSSRSDLPRGLIRECGGASSTLKHKLASSCYHECHLVHNFAGFSANDNVSEWHRWCSWEAPRSTGHKPLFCASSFEQFNTDVSCQRKCQKKDTWWLLGVYWQQISPKQWWTLNKLITLYLEKDYLMMGPFP